MLNSNLNLKKMSDDSLRDKLSYWIGVVNSALLQYGEDSHQYKGAGAELEMFREEFDRRHGVI